MFDPWTASIEEAIAAQGDKREGPRDPLFQWYGARRIESEREAVEQGDGFAVLACIRTLVTNGLAAPDWLAYAYNRRYDQVLSARARSWDDAFGQPYPGKKLPDLRRRRELRPAVHSAVIEAKEKDPKRAIDEYLFEQIGESFGIGKTLCAELYYEAKKMFGDTSGI